MANELLLHIPFDETGGNTAQDVSGNNDDLIIVEGEWVEGKKNNAIKLPIDGYAESIGYEMIDFSKDFSLSFWFKADPEGNEFQQTHWMYYKFNGLYDFLYIDLQVEGTDWTLIEIIQEGAKVTVLINNRLIKEEYFPEGWGIPTGFSIVNNNANGGFTYIDDLKLYDGVVYRNESITPPEIKNMNIVYKIGGFDFKDYGVRVEASRGLFDAPEIKQPFVVDWQDYHGDIIDLNNVRYKAKTIELDCWLYANSPTEFVDKCTNFINKFYGSGTKRLHFDNGNDVFVYEVYLPTGIKIEKRWRPSEMVGKFKLVLNEPQPIKRVVLFIRTSGNTTASITINSQKLCTIYWGDGTKTDNVHGSVTKTHTYASNGQYYIIVAGVVEEFSTFTTNGIIQNGANSFV